MVIVFIEVISLFLAILFPNKHRVAKGNYDLQRRFEMDILMFILPGVGSSSSEISSFWVKFLSSLFITVNSPDVVDLQMQDSAPLSQRDRDVERNGVELQSKAKA